MYLVLTSVLTISLRIAQTNRFAGPLLRDGTTREEAKQDGQEKEGHSGLHFPT